MSLVTKYSCIYTWIGEGHEDKSFMATKNYQGDLGHTGLLMVNPSLKIGIGKNIFLETSASYYLRHSDYRYYDTVNVHACEWRVGLGIGI